MEITFRSLIAVMHGMLFGGFFLLAVYGAVVELFRSACVSRPNEAACGGDAMSRFYLILTVCLGWAAVLTGAYLVYPWYRAIPPAGAALAGYPQRLLISSPTTSGWHSLGMEWKEHVAWLAPIAFTMVAYIWIKYRPSRKEQPQIRAATLAFALVALLSAGIAGTFGAMINKNAPVLGGPTIHLLGEGQK